MNAPADLSCFRKAFDLPASLTFLDHAFAGPLCVPARDRMIDAIARHAREGSRTFAALMDMCDDTKLALSSFINASPRELAAVNTTSATLSLVATGLGLQAGDNVVLPAIEYASNLYPWLMLRPLGVEVRLIPCRPGRDLDESLLAACDAGTKVVALSWIQFSNGYRHDIDTIGSFCREHGILFVVDANHALGAVDIDLQARPVDILVSQVFKWLCGPYNAGWIYVRSAISERVNPAISGPLSLELDESFLNTELEKCSDASKFLSGVPNYYGIIGTKGCIDLFTSVGMQRIEAKNAFVTAHLREGLQSKGYQVLLGDNEKHQSAITTFRHNAPRSIARWERLLEEITLSPSKVANAKGLNRTGVDKPHSVLCEFLLRRNIAVSMREGAVRVSPHFYNTTDEIDTLLDALPS